MKNSKIVLFLAAFAFVVGITGCEVESEKHEHTFSKEWTSDAIAHWHAATCEHKTEISGIAAHTFGEWKVTKEATETHEGERQRTCSVCKYVEKETVAKLEHTHKFNSWIVTKKATESEEGEKERTCSVCKYVEKDIILKLEHTHTFSEKWTSDAIAHWHAATCEHKTEISDKAAHIFGDWTTITNPTETSNGQKERTCSVCKYVESFIIPSLEHTHDFSEDWTNDETSHWHICNKGCSEVKDKAVHQWSDEKITKTATCTENGLKTYTCVCGKTKTEVISATGHSFSEEWANNAINHWHIATCEHTTEVSCLAEHSFGEWIETKVATETSCGKKYRTCSICNYEDKRSTSNILGALVRVKGKEILGTETWIPESKVFTKNRKGIISDLYVIDHEITRNEYRKVMGDSKSFYGYVIDADRNKLSKDDDKFFDAPANNVGWFEAILFCNTLSKKEGLKPCYTINNSTEPDKWGEIPTSKYNYGSNYELWNKCVCVFNADGYRLPTDVEWEYLARGGQAYEYSGSDKINDVGWYSDNSKVDDNCYIRIVKTKSPNGYGLYDMSGNVSELCWDLYRDDFIGVENISYQPPIYGIGNSHEARVLRGGNYDEKVDKCLVNYRAFVDFPVVNETAKGKRVGFRVVRTVTE